MLPRRCEGCVVVPEVWVTSILGRSSPRNWEVVFPKKGVVKTSSNLVWRHQPEGTKKTWKWMKMIQSKTAAYCTVLSSRTVFFHLKPRPLAKNNPSILIQVQGEYLMFFSHIMLPFCCWFQGWQILRCSLKCMFSCFKTSCSCFLLDVRNCRKDHTGY